MTDEQRIKSLEQALMAAISSLQELSNGWPVSELHEPVALTVDRANRLLPEGWDR